MAKREQKQERIRIAIIGDGKTESIYIESLKDAFKVELSAYALKPILPKHSSVAEIKRLIEANLMFDKVLCVIDMDTKLKDSKEMAQYQQLKFKYKRNQNVIFYETHPCTELWFYYHFQYTTSEFGLYEPDLKRQLRSVLPGYEKKVPFCTHQHIQSFGGDFDKAVKNGRLSMKSKNADNRNHSYSEMVDFIEAIGLVKRDKV